jgi:hypothetical protein
MAAQADWGHYVSKQYMIKSSDISSVGSTVLEESNPGKLNICLIESSPTKEATLSGNRST